MSESRVLIVGMGGLGSPVALYLAAAGVGHLCIADFDQVDLSNLQRQIIHQHDSIGDLKAESAAARLLAINPEIEVRTLNHALDYEDLLEQSDGTDLLVDCTDNFPTRFELNDVSRATGIPLVSGAAIRWEGQVTSFNPRDDRSPCYQCLYPDRGMQSATCEGEGVVAPLVGIIGAMQSMEAMNILLGNPRLCGLVWLFDARSMDWQHMRLKRDPHCRGCHGVTSTGQSHGPPDRGKMSSAK